MVGGGTLVMMVVVVFMYYISSYILASPLHMSALDTPPLSGPLSHCALCGNCRANRCCSPSIRVEGSVLSSALSFDM